MLDVCQRTILELIKQSQFGKTASLFCEDNIDWSAVYEEAIHQTVIGIIAHEIPDQVIESDGRWKEIRYRQIEHIIRYYYAEAELTRLLDEADIPFVILKGTSASVYYTHPERRVMGDIDFIVPQVLFEN